MSFRFVSILSAATGLSAIALSSSAGPPTAEPNRATEVSAELAAIPIERLPIAIHRRAARHLEVMRQTSDSAWFRARLGDRVIPMLRPGVSGVAHYEVPVIGPGDAPLGYVLLSTGAHDAPIVGSANGGRPASEELAAIAASRGQRVSRIWVVGPFSYVAEDERGELVAQIGTLPPRIRGVDRALLDLPEAQRHVRVSYATGAPRLEVAPAARGVESSYWSSWRELSADLSDPDSILVEIARRNAAPFWKLEHELETLPARLDPLELARVPLLRRGKADFAVSGPGAEHVAAERVDGPDGDAWVNLRVVSSPDRVAPVSIDVLYATGERERIGFALPARTPQLPRAVFSQFASTCKTVALRTHSGHYVRVEQGGIKKVDAQASRVGPWETFLLEPVTGKVAFRQASSGAYIEPIRTTSSTGGSVAGGAGLTAQTGGRSNVHLFTAVDGGGGRYAFKTESGHYLTAENGGGGAMKANRTTVGTSEKFLVLCNPPSPAVYFADGRDEPTAWKAQRKYDQIDSGTGGNTSSCVSGCGSTAWAMLIGYADYMASQNVARWSPYKRLYLQNGGRGKLIPDAIAPEIQDAGINKITLEIRGQMGDVGAGCSPTGERFTFPHIMAQASEYFWGRVPARVNADYDGAYITTATGKAKIKSSLTAKKAIAIGVGYHYPLAWGIRSATPQRWSPTDSKWIDPAPVAWFIDANYGWGQSFSHSVPLQGWFHGELVTAPYSRVTTIAPTCTLRAKSGGATGRIDRDYKCTTQFLSGERHVAMEVAQRLIERDVLPAAKAAGQRVCLLRDTDLQCAPCSTTDRLIVRMDVRSTSCPSGTVNELR